MKKIPLRKCTGCGEMKPKRELIRVVKAPLDPGEGSASGGDISLDLTGKKPGRGAYVCNSADCFALARKKRGLRRSPSRSAVRLSHLFRWKTSNMDAAPFGAAFWLLV